MHTTHFFRRLGAALLMGTSAMAAVAQSFPNQLVTMVVPYPAGGPADRVARLIQPELTRLLGQQIVVDNIGGVSGALGIQKVLSAPADGHTMAVVSPMELVLAPLGLSAVKFKPEDMRPAAILVSTSMVLLVRKDMAVSTVAELIETAKKPGAKDLFYGSIGLGSLYHLVAERFVQQTGVKMVQVPYKGGAPLLTDLMGGQIDLAFMPLAGGVPGLIKEGKVKALGVTARQPHPSFPNLPLLTTHPALENFEFGLWAGVAVSKATPDAVVERLNKALYEALGNADVRKGYELNGDQVEKPASMADLDRRYVAEIARYRAIAKSINLQPQ